jgi:uncharacterized protein (DUF2126 family)
MAEDWRVTGSPGELRAIELMTRLHLHEAHLPARVAASRDGRDEAEQLAARLQSELPPDAVMHVEPGEGLAWELMPKNPFAVFGGLGG